MGTHTTDLSELENVRRLNVQTEAEARQRAAESLSKRLKQKAAIEASRLRSTIESAK